MNASIGISADMVNSIDGKMVRLAPFSLRHRDDPAYLGWLRDREVIRTLNLPGYMAKPVSQEEVQAYCDRVMASETERFFAIERKAEGDFIGTLKVGSINRYAATADIGIMIGRRDLWGRGLAHDAIAAICRRLFRAEDFRRLTAGAMAINPGMIRAFEKLGFQREGCFRQHDRLGDDYIDHIHLGCMAEEFVG